MKDLQFVFPQDILRNKSLLVCFCDCLFCLRLVFLCLFVCLIFCERFAVVFCQILSRASDDREFSPGEKPDDKLVLALSNETDVELMLKLVSCKFYFFNTFLWITTQCFVDKVFNTNLWNAVSVQRRPFPLRVWVKIWLKNLPQEKSDSQAGSINPVSPALKARGQLRKDNDAVMCAIRRWRMRISESGGDH